MTLSFKLDCSLGGIFSGYFLGLDMLLLSEVAEEKSPGSETFNSYPKPMRLVFVEDDIYTKQI